MALVLPVIHHLNSHLSIEQAKLAMACGADGVFVISHHNKDLDVVSVAKAIKASHPDHLIGINLLNHDGESALNLGLEAGLDAVWDDSPGVCSTGISTQAKAISERLKSNNIEFFGSVAFKYQPIEPEPGKAAVLAATLGMSPTTSGSGTGRAPELEKITSMRAALNELNPELPLAIASGMTPDNVELFVPHLTHILVATGVSLDEHHFCEKTLRDFIAKVRASRPVTHKE